MTDRYHVALDGPSTSITECPDGEWPRWHHARAAAIQHLEEMVATWQEALWVLRHSGSFWEYRTLMKEKAAREETKCGERAQVQVGGTLN